jgi:hypothetical protein
MSATISERDLLDTYTHVLAGAEVPDEALTALLVWSRCGLDTPAS